jgi:hypothetical protein
VRSSHHVVRVLGAVDPQPDVPEGVWAPSRRKSQSKLADCDEKMRTATRCSYRDRPAALVRVRGRIPTYPVTPAPSLPAPGSRQSPRAGHGRSRTEPPACVSKDAVRVPVRGFPRRRRARGCFTPTPATPLPLLHRAGGGSPIETAQEATSRKPGLTGPLCALRIRPGLGQECEGTTEAARACSRRPYAARNANGASSRLKIRIGGSGSS